jgi:hypothetical protein
MVMAGEGIGVLVGLEVGEADGEMEAEASGVGSPESPGLVFEVIHQRPRPKIITIIIEKIVFLFIAK